jgi:hypothetical protein
MDQQFTIEIQNLNELVASLKKYPAIAAPRVTDAINKALALLAKAGDESTFQFKTPRALRTGYLLSTWGAPSRGLSLATSANLSGKIWTNAGYAIYVHEGTGAHLIQVRVKKVLANRKTGQIFCRVVHHPGTSPNRFVPRIIVKAQDGINQAFLTALNYIVDDIAKTS